MARKTDLKDILFPVELKPVFVEIEQGLSKTKKIVPQSRALINTETGYILGIVSKEYRLITNQEALELGKQCCEELLGLNKTANLQVFNVLAPSTRSYCHIDLIHISFSMNLWDSSTKPETYIPFVRVTNSYNTTRSLRFDIGFCRKLCLNGTIFESETIHFIYSHVKHEIGRRIRFDIQKDLFGKFKEKFIESMNTLRALDMPKEKGYRIFNIVMRVPRLCEIHAIKKDKKDIYKEYLSLTEYVSKKIDEYYNDLGKNAYALFNAITDMASNPPENKLFRRDINSMQRSAGIWVNDLKGKIKKNDFNLDSYIKELIKQYEQGIANN